MDFVRSLFEDLRSPDPALRFSVLERIDGIDWTPERLVALEQHLAEEQDPATRFSVQKIMARIRPGAHRETPAQRAQAIRGLLDDRDRDYLTLALLLDTVGPEESPQVLIALERHDWTQFPSVILPSILRFLKNFGSLSQVPAIESVSRHADPWVLSAAIEALEKLNPDSLRSLIVPLLDNSNPGIRSRAVRILYKTDPREAVRQFEASLESEDPDDRNAALFNAVFFPFSEIESKLLEFLSVEPLPALIRKAGVLFRSNPSPQQPMRLLELAASCQGERRSLIAEILRGVLSTLHQTGMVKTPPEEYERQLQESFRQNQATRICSMLQAALESPLPDTRKAAIQRLSAFAQTPYAEAAQEVLRERASREPDKEIAAILQRALVLFEPPPPAPEAPASPAAGLSIPPQIDARIFDSLRPHLTALAAVAEEAELLRLIQACGTFGRKEDVVFLRPFLERSDPQVVVTAIEAIQKLIPEALSPHFRRFLEHESDEIRAVAIRALSLFDKKRALELVEQLLQADDPHKRSLGIFCAGQFDAPAIQPLLLTSLETETDPDRFRQICSILQGNLSSGVRGRLEILLLSLEQPRAGLLAALLHDGTVADTQPASTSGAPSEKPAGATVAEKRLPSLEELVKSGTFIELPLTTQRSLLSRIDNQKEFRAAQPVIDQVKRLPLPRATCLELIAGLGKFGSKRDGEYLIPLLDHADPAIVAAAVIALGKVDLDRLLPFFGKLLQSEDPRIKGAVIKVFLRFDQAGALQQMKALSESVVPRARRDFLSLIPLFDPSTIQPMLLRFFERERHVDLKRQAGFVIATNPSDDGLLVLYKFAHDASGCLIPEWQDVWQTALNAAGMILDREITELEKRLGETLAAQKPAEQASPQGQKTGESSSAGKARAQGKEAARQQADSAGISPQSWFSIPSARVGVLLAVALIVGLIILSRPSGSPYPPGHSTEHLRGFQPPVIDLNGEIQWVDTSPNRPGILVVDSTPQKNRFFISVPEHERFDYRQGKRFQGKVTPYSREGATILAVPVTGK